MGHLGKIVPIVVVTVLTVPPVTKRMGLVQHAVRATMDMTAFYVSI